MNKAFLKRLVRRASCSFAIIGFFLLATGAIPSRDEIVLPELLAVELPKPQIAEIGPAETPLRELLQSATAGSLKVTHDRTRPLSIGGNLVTWTAWEGVPNESRARSTRSAYVYVLPYGQTPVGLSGDDHATAGNQSAKVIRDRMGKIHIAWLDAARPGRGYRIMYRRGAQDSTTGIVTWETDALPVSDGRSEAWGSYVAIDASENAVHFVWSTTETARYRRLVFDGSDWKFEPIRDTRAAGHMHDNGPDIAARSDDEIHVLTVGAVYALTKNGGRTWSRATLPLPAGMQLKSPALAIDSLGNAHFAFIGEVRNPKEWSSAKPNHGYWELRYVRRSAAGIWEDAQNVLASFRQWNDSERDWDILSDWPHIAIDDNNNIHIAWHGTAGTHVFGRDEAFYSSRPATGTGGNSWGTWSEPRALHPINAAKGEYYSFAPSIALSDSDGAAIAVVFYDITEGEHLLDYDARILRNGNIEGTPIVLSRLARTTAAAGREKSALSSWFPVAGPKLFRYPNGRVWLDVLTTAAVPEDHKSPHLIVYLRTEVTNYLRTVKR